MLKKIRMRLRLMKFKHVPNALHNHLYEDFGVLEARVYFDVKEASAKIAKKGCEHLLCMYLTPYSTSVTDPGLTRRRREVYNRMLNLKSPAPKKDFHYKSVLKSIADQTRRLHR